MTCHVADIACWLGVQAQELSKVSQLHAEAAARDLLAAKKAEMQVLPLLTGGKNPDPAAAELVKAQAAAKCAEQLKVSDAAVAVDDVCSTYRLVKLRAELLVVLAVLLQEPTSRVLPSSRSNLVQTVALAAVRLADGSAQHVTLLAGVIGACPCCLAGLPHSCARCSCSGRACPCGRRVGRGCSVECQEVCWGRCSFSRGPGPSKQSR